MLCHFGEWGGGGGEPNSSSEHALVNFIASIHWLVANIHCLTVSLVAIVHSNE